MDFVEKSGIFAIITCTIIAVVVVAIMHHIRHSKKQTYRIEQYFYNKGYNTGGTMWNNSKKVNYNTYYYKAPEGFNPHEGFDSVVFKIVEVNE